MRTTRLAVTLALSLLAMAALSGCATSSTTPKRVRGNFPSKYKTDSGGNLYIGPNYVENGGLRFYPDHVDTCWLADGFNFNGYDVVYVEPTQATVTIQTNQFAALAELESEVPEQFQVWLGKRNIFGTVLTDPSGIKPGARVLKMQTTVVKFAGGREPKPPNKNLAALGVGLYAGAIALAVISHSGGGNLAYGPNFWWMSPSTRARYRIYGKMMDGDKVMFEFEASQAGEPLGRNGRFGGLDSLMLDTTDFVVAVAGKYKLR